MKVFFGTSPRSAKFLEKAIKNGLKIDLIVSDPPKPIGKKQTLTENPAVSMAKEKKIPYVLSLNEISSTMKQLSNETIGLIFDYTHIIPNNIITLFSKGIINVHFSKLPQYRGPAPVQQTVLNGDKEAWISYFLITDKLDEGPIVAQTSLSLDQTETTEDLYQKLIEKSANEVVNIINDYLHDKIRSCQQAGTHSYTKKLTMENCKIDWKKSPEEIERLIRAAYPEPGAWTEIQYKVHSTENIVKRLKIIKSHLENGKLILDIVQLEGKNPVTWKQFQEGYPEAKFTN